MLTPAHQTVGGNAGNRPEKPRLLDLFCGAGGAAMGYARAGFEVVGVDHVAQPRYPFEFVQADAINGLGALLQGYRLAASETYLADFDAIHASPPCQVWSVATAADKRSNHVDLIPQTRELLEATGLPYVIENVPGSPLRNYVVLCGSSFGLKVRRHRLFETNWPLLVPPCNHVQQGQPVGVYGGGTGKGQKRGRKVMSSAEAMQVMEMPWADRAGATQAIPPVYTEHVGGFLLQHLKSDGRRMTPRLLSLTERFTGFGDVPPEER